MVSACVEIAEAVVAALNTPGVFSLPFTAVRAYDPQYPREEMKVLHVTVVAASKASERLDRHMWQHDVTVDVAVQQAYEEADNDTLDPLMALVEEIELYFGGGRRVTDAILVRMLPGCPERCSLRPTGTAANGRPSGPVAIDCGGQVSVRSQTRPLKRMSGGNREPLPERRPDVKGYIAGRRY